MTLKARYYRLLIIWIIIMMVAFFMPPSLFIKNPFTGPIFPGLDKIIHSLLFLIFGVLLARYFWHRITKDFQEITKKVLYFTLFFGFVIESIQSTKLISRSFEWLDLWSDVVGALIGVLCYWIYGKIMEWWFQNRGRQ